MMANWKYTLNIGNIWNNPDLSVEDKGKAIAQAIERKFPAAWFDWNSAAYDEEITDIAERFKDIQEIDDYPLIEQFDDIMEALYDWSDQDVEPFNTWPRNAMCWVETSIKAVQ